MVIPATGATTASGESRNGRSPFLTARWESLVLLNWVCPPDLLLPLVPAGTELDAWQGQNWVSLVGFLFRDTRVRGVPVPFHREFEEVNLRFYVRRKVDGEVRRAVVFIRELVPRLLVALIARAAYNEPYTAVAMDHDIRLDPEHGGFAAYSWRHRAQPFLVRAKAHRSAAPLAPGSDAEFMTEHYWGYTRQRDGGTLEYRVDHPPWHVWDADDARFDGDAGTLYGAGFAKLLSRPPDSAHIAVGSNVAVYPGVRIRRSGHGDAE